MSVLRSRPSVLRPLPKHLLQRSRASSGGFAGQVQKPRLLPWCCRSGAVKNYGHRSNGVRFLTSECVLRISASLGLAASRVSFDTILVGGQAFQFVIACTFVDVFMGSIPLLWDLKKSVLRNILGLIATATVLFGFNVVRLVVAGPLLPRTVLDLGRPMPRRATSF